MTQPKDSTNNCYKQLFTCNGKFIKNYSFNFGVPKIFNESPYRHALLGDFNINTRNFIGKYEGAYLLYTLNSDDLIRLQVKSTDGKCELFVSLTDEEKSKISYEGASIILKFKDFFVLLVEGKFSLK